MSPDDPWLEQYVRLPAHLQPALHQFGETRRYDLLHALAEALGLPTSQATTATFRLLDGLLEPLTYTDSSGTDHVLDERAVYICQTATLDLDLADACSAMTELGWGATTLGEGRVDDLPVRVRGLLGDRLVPYVQRMMRRWEERGIFNAPSA